MNEDDFDIRDLLAAFAVIGIINRGEIDNVHIISRKAYLVADAMLDVRKENIHEH